MSRNRRGQTYPAGVFGHSRSSCTCSRPLRSYTAGCRSGSWAPARQRVPRGFPRRGRVLAQVLRVNGDGEAAPSSHGQWGVLDRDRLYGEIRLARHVDRSRRGHAVVVLVGLLDGISAVGARLRAVRSRRRILEDGQHLQDAEGLALAQRGNVGPAFQVLPRAAIGRDEEVLGARGPGLDVPEVFDLGGNLQPPRSAGEVASS